MWVFTMGKEGLVIDAIELHYGIYQPLLLHVKSLQCSFKITSFLSPSTLSKYHLHIHYLLSPLLPYL